MLRSRGFVVLLVFAAVVGLFVSVASWAFLELVHQLQLAVFSDLPDALGYTTMPDWWPIPILVLAGIPVAFAMVKLPGNGGHIPAHGLQVGSTQPERGARRRAGGVRHPRSRSGARPRGAAHRHRRWPRRVRGEAREARRAAAAAARARRRRQLRGHLGDLRFTDRRRGARDRSQRARWCDAAADPHPRSDRGGGRIAGVHRDLQLDRAEHERVRAPAARAPALRPPHVGGDRVDARARRGRRADHLRHPSARAQGDRRGATQPLALDPGGGARGRAARVAVRVDDGARRRGGALLGSGPAPGARRQPRRVVDRRTALPDAVQGAGVERVPRQLPRRTDVPGDLPRRRRRDRRVAPARACRSRPRSRSGWG